MKQLCRRHNVADSIDGHVKPVGHASSLRLLTTVVNQDPSLRRVECEPKPRTHPGKENNTRLLLLEASFSLDGQSMVPLLLVLLPL